MVKLKSMYRFIHMSERGRDTDGNRDCHMERSKPETENKYHLILLIYVESRKTRKMNLLTSNEYVSSDTPGPLKRKDE